MQRAPSHPLRNNPAVRRARAVALAAPPQQGSSLIDDIKLFAMFFMGGLTFMTVYLA